MRLVLFALYLLCLGAMLATLEPDRIVITAGPQPEVSEPRSGESTSRLIDARGSGGSSTVYVTVPSTCLTTMSLNGGSTGTAVYVPCSSPVMTTSATTSTTLTSPSQLVTGNTWTSR